MIITRCTTYTVKVDFILVGYEKNIYVRFTVSDIFKFPIQPPCATAMSMIEYKAVEKIENGVS